MKRVMVTVDCCDTHCHNCRYMTWVGWKYCRLFSRYIWSDKRTVDCITAEIELSRTK